MGFKIPREGIGLLVTPMRKRQTEAFVSLGVSIGERPLNVLRDHFKIQFVRAKLLYCISGVMAQRCWVVPADQLV